MLPKFSNRKVAMYVFYWPVKTFCFFVIQIMPANNWGQLFKVNDMSLGNGSLKFQTLISEIHQYFLLTKC